MANLVEATIDTKRKAILYRDFIIEETFDPWDGHPCWEYAHEDYRRGKPISGTCETIFEAVGLVEAWYDRGEANA